MVELLKADLPSWISAPIPASVLRGISLWASQANWTSADGDKEIIKFDEECFWEPALNILGIPVAYYAHCAQDMGEDVPDTIDDGILAQLIGQEVHAGMRFTYEGKECYVVGIGLGKFEREAIGSLLTAKYEIDFLIGVETRFIDMDA